MKETNSHSKKITYVPRPYVGTNGTTPSANEVLYITNPAYTAAPANTARPYITLVYHRDHLGSVRAITTTDGTLLEQNDYYPFGLRTTRKQNYTTLSQSLASIAQSAGNTTYNASLPKYLYNGKEKQELGTYTSNYIDYGARFYNPVTLRWNTQDPLAEKYMGYSPYTYCKNDPINNLDPNGLWDIRISASSDRKKNPYAIMTVTDRRGNEIYKTIVRVMGTGGRDRKKKNADTPIGTYKMIGWKTNKDIKAYGPNPYIILDYLEGEALGLRNLLRIHGGRNQDELRNTQGCVRIADEDIKELKDIVDWMQNTDEKEKMGIVTIDNDLYEHIDYSQRKEIKSSLVLEGGVLNTVTVTSHRKEPNNNDSSNNNENDISLWKLLINFIFGY